MTSITRLAIVALAFSCTACSTLSQVIEDKPITIDNAIEDVRDIAAAVCAIQSPQRQNEIRGAVAVLDGMVRSGQVGQVRTLLERQAVTHVAEQYRALAWVAINRGMARLSKPEWEEAYSAAIGAAVSGCAEALGVGVA